MRSCNDYPDVASYDAEARAAMPDIDAVTMATPPADAETRICLIPNAWPAGNYVAWIEANTEGDYNATFNDLTYPTPRGTAWDGWAMDTGYPYRGQPSVVYSVPFSLVGVSSTSASSIPAGYGSVDGNVSDVGLLHMMDGTITNDSTGAPGSGADRLRQTGPDTQGSPSRYETAGSTTRPRCHAASGPHRRRHQALARVGRAQLRGRRQPDGGHEVRHSREHLDPSPSLIQARSSAGTRRSRPTR